MVCVVGIYNGTLFGVLVPRNSCSTTSVVDIPEQFRKKQQFLSSPSSSSSSSCGLTMNEEEERSGAILLWLTAVELRYALEVPLRGWTTSRSTDHNNNTTIISTFSEPPSVSSSPSLPWTSSLLSAAIPFRSDDARQRFEHLSSLPTIELHYHVYRYLTLELGWALRHAEAMYGVAWIGYRGDVRQGHGECLIDVRAVSTTKERDDDDDRKNKEEEVEIEAVAVVEVDEVAVVGRRWSLDVVANRLARSVGKQLVVAVVVVAKDHENEKEEEEDEEDGKENQGQRQRTFGKVSLWKNGQRWDAK